MRILKQRTILSIDDVFEKFYMPTSFAFIGLILGTVKLVIKQAEIKKVTFSDWLCLLLTFSFSIYLVVLENSLNVASYTNSNSYLILAGVLMSARNCYSWC